VIASGTAQKSSNGEVRISILHVPQCVWVPRLRGEVEAALSCLHATAVVEEIEGSYLSPTLLVDGIEIPGYTAGSEPACRIDIPSRKEIAAALLAGMARRTHPRSGGVSG
jgi:hypothetical protein